ncbi:copper resistance CopC/CopD family protein [Neobacillus cucumis]|uniref:copper resistance CopC/CopD family protein n=1 Tax=Neobacillus cucumis TaxID=1740721 RepID=UPI002E228F5D|nr:copper resistance CopC/CopD family protein [Neobacillus cucumis]
MKHLKNGSLMMAVIYLCLVLFPSLASAHAYIIKSTPYENEILNQVPKKVSIVFDESIQASFNSIEVFDSKGNRVDQKNGRIDPKNPSMIETGLGSNLPDDTYSIKWRVVSSDGHPVEGVIPFQIGKENHNQDSSSVSNQTKGYTPKMDLIIIRWLQYISNACLVGVLFLFLFILPKGILENSRLIKNFNKVILLSLFILFVSILLSLPLQEVIELGTSWSQIIRISLLLDMVEYTLFGKIWIIQITGLFILFIFTYLLIKSKFNALWLWISFILGIGLLVSKSFTSHAASSTNVFLTVPIDFIHLLSASIWIGGLIGLVALIPLSRQMDTKTLFLETIQRFSKWGILLVIVLSVTGFIGSLSYIPNLRTLLTSNYGRVLLGKVLLLIIMIVFAAFNFLKGKQNREKGLPTTLWGELVTGLIVLMLSVLLTNLPTAMSSPGPFKETNTGQRGSQITFEVTPNVIGENNFVLTLRDQKGQPLKNIEQVTLTFTSLEMDMGDDTKTLIKVKEGSYKVKGMNFNMAGRWNVHVHVLTKELETIDTDFKVLVGSQ